MHSTTIFKRLLFSWNDQASSASASQFFPIVILTFIFWCSCSTLFGQHPADNYTLVPLCNLDLNRTATKLSPGQLATVTPAAEGYVWNSQDNTTLAWRPQGITGIDVGCKQFSVVSWYGRHINYPFPCNGNNLDYRNRGSRVSFVDITDMDSIRYRHVLLVDENYNSFYDMHAGGLAIVNDTLYVPDSRGGTDAVYAFDLGTIKDVPPGDQATYYNYGYILQKIPNPTDSLPINPSFISYDWDEQRLLVGSFKECGTPFCADDSSNRMLWFGSNYANRNSPFYDGFFGKMQGAASRNDINTPNKKNIWVSRSFGYTNNSQLFALNLDLGVNTVQGQSIEIGNNYAEFTLPPGLEDLHITPGNDTIWSCTEFSPNHPPCVGTTNNQRFVFAIPTANILPPGACIGDVNYIQNEIDDDTVCLVVPRTYHATTDYVSYAQFNPSKENWIDINALSDTLANSSRSVFMWIKQSTTVSNTSQMLLGINTSGGGNICNLQIGTNEKLGVFDGDNSHYGPTSITDGLWHHVGYTYNGTSNLTQVYVDGILETSYVNDQTTSNTNLYSLGQEFDSGLSKGNFFEGEMTEVSIWNEVLVPSEITLLMNSPVAASHPRRANLMAYYPMNKLCGDDLTIVADISGNELHGNAEGVIGSAGVGVQTIDDLEQVPGFNSMAYFSKIWTENSTPISIADSIVITPYSGGNYNLELARGPFRVNEAWDILATDTSSQSIAICHGDSLQVGTSVYSASGTYLDLLQNSVGCDSVVTTQLSVKPPVDNSVSLAGDSLIANNSNGIYQWYSCSGTLPTSLLPGETNQLFLPTTNGNYAVEVTEDGCSSFSDCFSFAVDRAKPIHLEHRVFPNPSEGKVYVEIGELQSEGKVEVFNQFGLLVFKNPAFLNKVCLDLSSLASGIYMIKVSSARGESQHRLVIQY